MLKANDVKNKTFSTVRFKEGYEMDEVDDFLDKVSDALVSQEQLIARLRHESLEGDGAGVSPSVGDGMPAARPLVAADSGDGGFAKGFADGFAQGFAKGAAQGEAGNPPATGHNGTMQPDAQSAQSARSDASAPQTPAWPFPEVSGYGTGQ